METPVVNGFPGMGRSAEFFWLGVFAAETIEANSRLRVDSFSAIRRFIAQVWAKNRRKYMVRAAGIADR